MNVVVQSVIYLQQDLFNIKIKGKKHKQFQLKPIYLHSFYIMELCALVCWKRCFLSSTSSGLLWPVLLRFSSTFSTFARTKSIGNWVDLFMDAIERILHFLESNDRKMKNIFVVYYVLMRKLMKKISMVSLFHTRPLKAVILLSSNALFKLFNDQSKSMFFSFQYKSYKTSSNPLKFQPIKPVIDICQHNKLNYIHSKYSLWNFIPKITTQPTYLLLCLLNCRRKLIWPIFDFFLWIYRCCYVTDFGN